MLIYALVIYFIVSSVSQRKDVTTTPSLSTESTTTQVQNITTQAESTTTQVRNITTQAEKTAIKADPTEQGFHTIQSTNKFEGKYYNGTVIMPNETNVQASGKESDHSFFQSMLVLVVLLKGKFSTIRASIQFYYADKLLHKTCKMCVKYKPSCQFYYSWKLEWFAYSVPCSL